jgi:Cu-processing system permease protein
MFHRIHAIALNTFREAMRKRVLYAILVLVAGVLFLATYLGDMSLNEEARMTRDVSLSAIRAFGCVTAIILGSLLLHSEIERRTIHVIVSKPIERYEFILGKYAGMVATLGLLIAAVSGAMVLLLALQGVAMTTSLAMAIILLFVEVLLVAGVSLFFSAFSGPVLTGVFSFIVWRLGHVTPEMRDAIATTDDTWIRVASEFALRIVPDMHLFSVSGTTLEGKHVSIHTDTFVSWGYVATSSLYGLVYLGVLLLLASVIFARRDFV